MGIANNLLTGMILQVREICGRLEGYFFASKNWMEYRSYIGFMGLVHLPTFVDWGI